MESGEGGVGMAPSVCRSWRVVAFLGVLGALVGPGSAHGAQTRVCLDFELGDKLWDASPRQAITADYGEDHGRWEGSYPFPARRWLARVIDETTGESVWGFAPLDEDGCTGATTDVEFEPATTFRVEYVRWARWEGGDRSIVGYDCEEMGAEPVCNFQLDRAIVGVPAVSGGTTYATLASIDTEELEHALWSASSCEERIPLHENFELYLLSDPDGQVQPGSSASLLFGGRPTVTLADAGWHSKFTVCHE